MASQQSFLSYSNSSIANIFPIPNQANTPSAVPITHLCTRNNFSCPPPDSGAITQYARCLDQHCASQLTSLNNTYSFSAPITPGTLGNDTQQQDLDSIDSLAASVEICGFQNCISDWIRVSAAICLPLNHPVLQRETIRLPSLQGVTTSPDLAAKFATYTQNPQQDLGTDPLGVCVPAFPVGTECSNNVIDPNTNLVTALSINNVNRQPQNMTMMKTVPLNGVPLHFTRIPPTSTSPRTDKFRSSNMYSSGVCQSQTISATPAKFPGSNCTSNLECVLGVCDFTDMHCVLRPVDLPPMSSSPAESSIFTSPIIWAQISTLIIASFILIGWSRGGIEWRRMTQFKLIRFLAKLQPSRNTMTRELACMPADNRMLANYRPRRDRSSRRQRQTLRVHYLNDGTPEWVHERRGSDDEDDVLPRYAPTVPQPSAAITRLHSSNGSPLIPPLPLPPPFGSRPASLTESINTHTTSTQSSVLLSTTAPVHSGFTDDTFFVSSSLVRPVSGVVVDTPPGTVGRPASGAIQSPPPASSTR